MVNASVSDSQPDVLIIGAGLSGLCCAKHLIAPGVSCQILEADDTVGGRVRTDQHEGFLLDRGFQVLLTAYPETQRLLNYEALDLKPFYPGALVQLNGRLHRFADPWRHPLDGLRSLRSPIGTVQDKLRIARVRRQVRSGSLDELFGRPERTTLTALQEMGFSTAMIDQFFRPFLGGVFLEPDLQTSSRFFEFVFRMFSSGDTTLPAAGMGAIPAQLASHLPPGTIQLKTPVQSVHATRVTLKTGISLSARAVVIATEGPEAARLAPDLPTSPSRSVTCLYFAADTPPISDAILVLNGDGKGPVNNLCIPSNVSSTYAPDGAALVSVTVLDPIAQQSPELETEVRQQLNSWFGSSVHEWRLLQRYHLHHALPGQTPPALCPSERSVRLDAGRYVCGDHRDTPSIHGAMVSGRRAAQAILDDFKTM